jgi:DNA-binding NarL/FixJ family response regulator
MSHFVTVLIADKEEPFRQTLQRTLTQTEGIHVVGLANTAEEASTLTHILQPDVILLDVQLLEGESAPAETALLMAGKVLMLSEPGQEVRTLELLRMGARGFLVKGEGLLAKLSEAIRAIQRGEAILSPRLTNWLLGTISN